LDVLDVAVFWLVLLFLLNMDVLKVAFVLDDVDVPVVVVVGVDLSVLLLSLVCKMVLSNLSIVSRYTTAGNDPSHALWPCIRASDIPTANARTLVGA